MPLLAMSANIQDGGGAETPSRKRTLQDFLTASKQASLPNKPATPSKLRLVTDADDMVIDTKENNAVHTTDSHPDSPPDSPLSDISDMSDSPLSLMTDASSSNNNNSMPSTPGKLPQLVIDIDSTPPSGAKLSSSTSSQPPAKRKKLTPAEREEKAKADLARKQEKEKAEAAKKLEKEKAEAARKAEKEKKEKAEAAKKQERDEQKALAEAKKKALAEEKEKKRKQKEEEDQRKAEEKEKKRKEKEDEERKVQEAKNKKERSQLRLNSFFTKGNTSSASPSASSSSTTPSTSLSAATSTSASGLLLTSPHKNGSPSPSKSSTASPQKGASAATEDADNTSTTAAAPSVEISEYDRIFKPFFIKENVIMATHLYGMDEETKAAKSRILDEHLSGSRGDFTPPAPFSSASAVDYFHLACDSKQRPLQRGTAAATRPSVRKIMNTMHDSGYGAGSGNAQTKMALDLLKKVPMKYLFFREDVRPAYFGTVTSQPPQARLSRLARNPLLKTVLPLNYDYDSEAEWVDDGDGEDVDDLDDDEEDLADDDGEMSDFLDDSEEGGMPLRPAFSGGMEPDSTGICWENLDSNSSRADALPRPELDQYRMEFMIDHAGPIDPFSTKYWAAPEPVEPVEVKAKPAKLTKAAKAKAASAAAAAGTSVTSQPAAAPSDAFAALNGSTATSSTTTTTPSKAAAASTTDRKSVV